MSLVLALALMTDAELDCVPDACTRSALRELADYRPA
jgi:hypothetical protein